jgi:hypothetical protein
MNHANNTAFAVTEQLSKTQHATIPICSRSVVCRSPDIVSDGQRSEISSKDSIIHGVYTNGIAGETTR